jgi:hypothetical protein
MGDLFWRRVFLSFSGLQLLTLFWRYLLQEPSFGVASVSGLYEVTAIVGSLPSRLFALIVLFLFGIPTLLGLCYCCSNFVADKDWLQTDAGMVEFSIFVLTASWFAWYLIFSVSWIRYLFPASFFGSLFLARMLHDLTGGFDAEWSLNDRRFL